MTKKDFMNKEVLSQIILFTESNCKKHDISHDIDHIRRVAKNALEIHKNEGGDIEIILTAAYLHDLVIYPKDDPRNKNATDDSAKMAEKFLNRLPGYPKNKIPAVVKCIKECSFSKNITPETLEGMIVRDADMLESVGVIAIARTFASSGVMGKKLFNHIDPFCENRKPEPYQYALDLFPSRLFLVEEKMFTKTGKQIAKQRADFLRRFWEQAKKELT